MHRSILCLSYIVSLYALYVCGIFHHRMYVWFWAHSPFLLPINQVSNILSLNDTCKYKYYTSQLFMEFRIAMKCAFQEKTIFFLCVRKAHPDDVVSVHLYANRSSLRYSLLANNKSQICRECFTWKTTHFINPISFLMVTFCISHEYFNVL